MIGKLLDISADSNEKQVKRYQWIVDAVVVRRRVRRGTRQRSRRQVRRVCERIHQLLSAHNLYPMAYDELCPSDMAMRPM